MNKYDEEKYLIYLYWLPKNYKNFVNYIEHQKEIDVFSNELKNTKINFVSMSYLDLWDILEKNILLKEHVNKIKAKYFFDIR